MEVNQQFEDENHGSGGSRSSIDERARVFVSTEAEMKRMMIRFYEQTILPMIHRDVKAELQKILSHAKEELGLDWTGNSGNMASASGSQTLQLQFRNGISTPVSTGVNIEGKDHKPIVVALVDGISGQIVKTGAGAAAKVELVVLKGDCDDNAVENWTTDDFNNKIVREWEGKKILQGNTYLNLKEGIGSVGKISFTQNSVWTKNHKCRLGARLENAVFATSVIEAKTESFLVRDKRSLSYTKHQIPSLSDQVWRLKKISRRGVCYDRLSKAHINTVMDFRTLLAINPKMLKDILGVSPKIWKDIENHARKCEDDKGVYLYHYPRDGQKRNGVVFNLLGQLVGLISESHFVPSDELPSDKKADAEKLVVSSSEHWGEVVSFNDEASLISYLQSGIALNSSPRNGLNLVTPQTIDTHDHTSYTSPQVITPIFPINANNWGYDNVGVMGQSQSPKRSASEHAISNSQKKPRDDYPRMSPSTPSVVGASSMTSWEVASFNGEASLISYLQSGIALNSSPRNGLNLVTSQTIDTHDHTSYTSPQVITPIFPINANNWGYDNVGVMGQSQSPKRSASEHAMSNSQKKPRDDYPRMSPSTPSVVGASSMANMNATGKFNQSCSSRCQEPNTLNHDPVVSENDDYLQYFNFSALRWKIVLSVVEWISIISKRCKRKMTIISNCSNSQ